MGFARKTMRATVAFLAACSSSPSSTSPDAGGGSPVADAGGGGVPAGDASSGGPMDGGATGDASNPPSDGGTKKDGGSTGVYPVKASANGRYLVDQSGAPFLLVGDAPQALIANVSTSDAEAYFTDRASLGFNALWVNLLCDTYTAGNADGTTYDGLLPFVTSDGKPVSADQYDITKPNEDYFKRVDAMVELAGKAGLVVFLEPIETGGWLATLRNDGLSAAMAYGQYVGQRYASYPNIVWQSGNDFQSWSDSGDDALVAAVAKGIASADPGHLQTIELSYDNSSSSDDPTWVPLLGLDAAYTYYPTYAQVLHSYNRAASHPIPVFLVESTYDNEDLVIGHIATTKDLRMEEYWTLLSGGTGFLYGNHYTWTFTSSWQQNLDTSGAKQIAHLEAFFRSRNWQDLAPDDKHGIVVSGYGTFDTGSDPFDTSDYVAAAATPDGKLAVAYLPTGGTITVNLAALGGTAGTGGMLQARWFDPSSGEYSPVAGSPFAGSGTRDFVSPGNNADGDSDWVLVLESA